MKPFRVTDEDQNGTAVALSAGGHLLVLWDHGTMTFEEPDELMWIERRAELEEVVKPE